MSAWFSSIQFTPVWSDPVQCSPVQSSLGLVVFKTLVRSSITCTSACRGWSSHNRHLGRMRSPPVASSISPSGPRIRSRRTLEHNTTSLSQQPNFLHWRLIVCLCYTHRCCGTATPTRPEFSPARFGLHRQCSVQSPGHREPVAPSAETHQNKNDLRKAYLNCSFL